MYADGCKLLVFRTFLQSSSVSKMIFDTLKLPQNVQQTPILRQFSFHSTDLDQKISSSAQPMPTIAPITLTVA